jgi:hypothetical protein
MANKKKCVGGGRLIKYVDQADHLYWLAKAFLARLQFGFVEPREMSGFHRCALGKILRR